MQKTVKINKDFIEQYMTKNGGWTKKQLELIGVSWPPIKGWKTSLDVEISQESANEFKNISKSSIDIKEKLKD